MADPTIAVAFGGGGARGLAHIHIIETLNELGLTPIAISGVSIGAIMGTAMASGLRGEEIREHTLRATSDPVDISKRLWNSRRTGWKSITEGVRLGQFDIERILKAFLPEAIPQNFFELSIPTKLIATDFYDHREVIMEDGDLLSAIAASAAIPAIFKTVKRNDRYLIDGGIYNPLPYDHVIDKADIVIAVDVVGLPQGDPTKAPSTVDAAFGAAQLTQQSIINHKLAEQKPDIMLRPNIHNYRVLDFIKAKEVLDVSSGIRDELKQALDKLL